MVDGVAVAGEEDQDRESDDTDNSPLQFCNNKQLSSSLVIAHSIVTVVVKSVDDGLEAVVLDDHLVDAVVPADDVFPPETVGIPITRSTLLVTCHLLNIQTRHSLHTHSSYSNW